MNPMGRAVRRARALALLRPRTFGTASPKTRTTGVTTREVIHSSQLLGSWSCSEAATLASSAPIMRFAKFVRQMLARLLPMRMVPSSRSLFWRSRPARLARGSPFSAWFWIQVRLALVMADSVQEKNAESPRSARRSREETRIMRVPPSLRSFQRPLAAWRSGWRKGFFRRCGPPGSGIRPPRRHHRERGCVPVVP